MTAREERHLPRLAPIDSYGNGGFRFAEMSHRGSLLCLPDGMWAWAAKAPDDIDPAALAPVFEAAGRIDVLIIGAGASPWIVPAPVRAALREAGITGLEALQTGPAVRTYNILLAEGRRLAAALLAVD